MLSILLDIVAIVVSFVGVGVAVYLTWYVRRLDRWNEIEERCYMEWAKDPRILGPRSDRNVLRKAIAHCKRQYARHPAWDMNGLEHTFSEEARRLALHQHTLEQALVSTQVAAEWQIPEVMFVVLGCTQHKVPSRYRCSVCQQNQAREYRLGWYVTKLRAYLAETELPR